MSTASVSLVLLNANVLTMDHSRPRAEAVAIAGERIAAVGNNHDVGRLSSAKTQVLDCQGMTLLPGFNDAHCHLPGLARRLQDLDCGPERAPSIAELQALVHQRAAMLRPGSWVRGFGYDDLLLNERRHPNRPDLDIAAPGHPVWLEHRSGHSAALNSLALALAGIHIETPDPPGGLIERDLSTGEPTGVLYEMRSFLRQRLGTIRSQQDFEDGMRAANELLQTYGITSAQDAGADNGVERWRTFQHLQSDGTLSCRITMFAGADRLDEFVSSGLTFGAGNDRLRLGHAKIMLTLTSGALHPPPEDLKSMVNASHRVGFPVAIHCIEEDAIAAAAVALRTCRQPNLVDRIEHCAEGTQPLVHAVRRSGATVVTQPGFLYHNGPAYRENVEPGLLPHLYPAGALHRAGVATAFGSDAPVIDPNPWPAIYSAVTRRASDGHLLAAEAAGTQAICAEEALRMYTFGSAQSEGTSAEKGSIAPGKLADLVLVNADPLAADPEHLPSVKPVMTIVGGTVVWGNI